MNGFLKKRATRGKIIAGAMLVIAAAVAVLLAAFIKSEIKALGVAAIIGVMAAIVLLPILLEVYLPALSCYGYLKKHDLTQELEDINEEKLDLEKSKICLGDKGFLSKKSGIALPYSRILWVYVQVTSYYGVKGDEKVCIGCRDGRFFNIKAQRQELEILTQKIGAQCFDLIVGYGTEQQKRYIDTVRQYKKNV